MEQKILVMYHVRRLNIFAISKDLNTTNYAVKKIIDDYAKGMMFINQIEGYEVFQSAMNFDDVRT